MNRCGERRKAMEILIFIGMGAIALGVGILWLVHDFVPMGDPGKCRIIRRFGKETGTVRGPEPFMAWFRGFMTDFAEVARRFDVEVPTFQFECMGDRISLEASPTLIVEMAPDGGKQFNLNGEQEGTRKRIARVVRTEVQEYAATPEPGTPQTYQEAKKQIAEFVLRAVNELVEGDLLAEANAAPDRQKFLEDLEGTLSEGSGDFRMENYGLILRGFNMGNFMEPKIISDAEAAKVAVQRLNEQKAKEIAAFRERMDALTKGKGDVSFKDATLAVQIQEGTVKHSINEDIIRFVDDGTGDGDGKLIGGMITAARAHGAGGKGNGGKKP